MRVADAAEAQMGRGCPGESPGDATTAAEAQLDEDEEDWEWLTALGATAAPPSGDRGPSAGPAGSS